MEKNEILTMSARALQKYLKSLRGQVSPEEFAAETARIREIRAGQEAAKKEAQKNAGQALLDKKAELDAAGVSYQFRGDSITGERYGAKKWSLTAPGVSMSFVGPYNWGWTGEEKRRDNAAIPHFAESGTPLDADTIHLRPIE